MNELGLEWIKHFDEYTKAQTIGCYRLLILDGHASHHSTDFELYCKDSKIITLCMPAHSSHILQPLDVGCFSPLKASYGKQIEQMMRMQITHITKEDFFDAFVEAFHASITANNIQAGFRETGLVSFDPESVVSRLDPKPVTPSPPSSRPEQLHLGPPRLPPMCKKRHSVLAHSSGRSNTIKGAPQPTFSTLLTCKRRTS